MERHLLTRFLAMQMSQKRTGQQLQLNNQLNFVAPPTNTMCKGGNFGFACHSRRCTLQGVFAHGRQVISAGHSISHTSSLWTPTTTSRYALPTRFHFCQRPLSL